MFKTVFVLLKMTFQCANFLPKGLDDFVLLADGFFEEFLLLLGARDGFVWGHMARAALTTLNNLPKTPISN